MIKSKMLLCGLFFLAALAASLLVPESQVAYANSVQWTSAAGPEPSGFSGGNLDLIECTSTSSCQAVGYYYDADSVQRSLMQSYDGTAWNVVATSDPVGSHTVALEDLACVSATFCQAVGSYRDGSNAQHPLIYTYNGSSWSVATSPEPVGSQYVTLLGVDCTSTTFCQAVGSYQDGNGDGVTLIQTYDGTAWSIATASDPVNAEHAGLQSVDCVSTTFCQAVGYSRDASNYSHTQVQAYDGTSWSSVVSPDVISDASNGSLSDVTCRSVTFCQAVGFYRDPDFTAHNITKMYDGTDWSIAPIANQGGFDIAVLHDIDCASSTFCQAVGSYQDISDVQHPLLHTYNGTGWSVTAIPEPSDFVTGNLAAVSCASVTSCHTTGVYQKAVGSYAALIQSYDGASWSVASGFEPAGAKYTVVLDIDCVSSIFCQAVGLYRDAGNDLHPLMATYGLVQTPTPANPGSGSFTPVSDDAPFQSSIGSNSSNSFSNATSLSVAKEERVVILSAPNNAPLLYADQQDKTTNESATTTDAPRQQWWWVFVMVAGAGFFMAIGLKVYRRH